MKLQEQQAVDKKDYLPSTVDNSKTLRRAHLNDQEKWGSIPDSIQIGENEYQVLVNLTRKEAENLLNRTGVEVSFSISQEFKINFILDEGHFGKLRIGRDKNGQYVGIKIIRGPEVEQEAKIQEALTGLPHLMPSLGYLKAKEQDETILYQVMPLAGLGNGKGLKEYLIKLEDNNFKKQILLHIARGLIQGLTLMHEKGFYHLDVKPDNLVVDSNGEVYVIDFGCSEYSNTGLIDCSQSNGYRNYFSLERWQESQCEGSKIDAWAVGLTLFELATGKTCFDSQEIADAIEKNEILSYFQRQLETIPELESPIDGSYWYLIKGLLALNPENRWDMKRSLEFLTQHISTPSSQVLEDTLGYLREFVQNERMKYESKTVLKESTSPELLKSSTFTHSPLRLPSAHFTSYVTRTQLQEAIEASLLQPIDCTKTAGLTALHGMGGTGKSTTALYAIYQSKIIQNYELRLWLSGTDSEIQLNNHYYALALEFHLVHSDGKVSMEEIRNMVLKYLNQWLEHHSKPWLMVFDNADHYESLKAYLPVKGGHCLITSRNREWPISPIPVDVMTPQDAETLLIKILQRNDETIPDLAKELGYLPLALCQAGAYSRVEQVNLREYLAALQQQAQVLLNTDKKLFGKSLPVSIGALWQVTLSTLKSKYPTEAISLLKYLSLLSPDFIPEELLASLLGLTVESLRTFTNLLENYALLKTMDVENVSVHRLLQEVVRIDLQETNEKSEWVNKTLNLIFMRFDYELENLSSIPKNEKIISHVLSIIRHTYQLNVDVNKVEKLFKKVLHFYNYWKQGFGALDLAKEFMNYQKGLYGNKDIKYADSLCRLAEIEYYHSDYQGAEAYYKESNQIYENNHETQSRCEHIDSESGLGDVYYKVGKYPDAIKQYQYALSLLDRYNGKEKLFLFGMIYHQLGNVYNKLGKIAEAKQYYEDALIRRKGYYKTDKHPQIARTLKELGDIHLSLKNYKEALKYIQLTLDIERTHYKTDCHPDIEKALCVLAEIQFELGNEAESLENFRKSSEIWKKIYPGNHPGLATNLLREANLYFRHQLKDKAHEKFLEAYSILEKKFSPGHPQIKNCKEKLKQCRESAEPFENTAVLKEKSLALSATLKIDQQQAPHQEASFQSQPLEGLRYVQSRLNIDGELVVSNEKNSSVEILDKLNRSKIKANESEENLSVINSAVRLFLGEEASENLSHLEFKTWYHPEICQSLLQMADNNVQCIRVMFLDAGFGNNTQTFKKKLQTLIILGNLIQKNAIFISKEPGADNHFICGLVKGNQLLLINPLGIPNRHDCYQTLAELQQENTLRTIWLSSQSLQKQDYEGEGLYSCGPITLELAMHILSYMTEEALNNFWDGELKTQVLVTQHASGLVFSSTSITPLLPDSLLEILKVKSQENYHQQVLKLRSNHFERLKTFPELFVEGKNLTISTYLEQRKNEAPAQVVFNALLTQHKQAYNIEEFSAYRLLEKELKEPTNFLVKIETVQLENRSKKHLPEVFQQTLRKNQNDKNMIRYFPTKIDYPKNLHATHLGNQEKWFDIPRLIQAGKNEYQILVNLTRGDAEHLLRQTGIDVPFASGQEIKVDFILDKGHFGKLRIGKDKNGQYVGIKIVRGSKVEQEAKVQKTLTGLPHLMPSLDYLKANERDENILYQVMPLAGLGSGQRLREYLAKLEDNDFKEQVLFHVAKGLIKGLATMHKKGFYHLDIKSDNLVIDGQGNVYVIDFGCSEHSTTGLIDCSQANGDRNYFSLERWQGAHCEGSKIDAWAVGLTLLELATDKSYFNSENIKFELKKEAILSFFQQQIELIKEIEKPTSYWILIKGLLALSPEIRWDMKQSLDYLIQHFPMPSQSVLENTLGRLREFVQNERTERYIDKSFSSIEPSSIRTSNASIFSPLRLPAAHFTGYVVRNKLHQLINASLLQPFDYAKSTALTVLHGMGGTGKSTTALYSIYQPKIIQHYELRLWLSAADSEIQLNNHYYALALDFHLVHPDEKINMEEIRNIILRHLNQWLEHHSKPWLMVFDNADQYESLKAYLPSKGGHCLITSRNREWTVSLIPIDVMTSQDAEILLENILQRKDKDIPALVKELGYLPLALCQAGAYSRVNKVDLRDYLTTLREQGQILLNSDKKLFGKSLPVSMGALWQVTLSTLETKNPESIVLLKYASLLSPDFIPKEVLASLLAIPTESLNALTTLLENYALLKSLDIENVSVHRLLQTVVRESLEVSEFKSYLMPTMEGLNERCQSGVSLGELNDNRRLALHLSALENIVRLKEERLEWQDVEKIEWSMLLFNVAHLSNTDAQYQKALKYYQQSLAINKSIYGDNHPAIAHALNNIGAVYEAQDQHAQALEHYQQSLVIDKAIYGDNHPTIARSLNNIGLVYKSQSQYAQALEYYQQSLAIYKATYGDNHSHVAMSLNNIGLVYKEQGQHIQALGHYKQSLVIYSATYGDNHPDVARSLNNIGLVYEAQGQYAQALDGYQKSLIIYKAAYGDNHPNVAKSLNNIGLVYEAQGQYVKALEHFQQSLVINKAVHGDNHSVTARSLNNIGLVYKSQGQYSQALEHFQQSLAIYRATYGDNHPDPDVARSLNNIGLVYGAQGQYAQALEVYQQSLAIYKTIYGDNHSDVAMSLNNIGLVYDEQGQHIQALAYYQQSLTIDRAIFGDTHPNVATSLNNIGSVYNIQGQYAQALEVYQQSLAIYKIIYGDQHPNVATNLNNIGSVYNAQGQYAKALEHYQQSLAIYKAIYRDDHPDVASSLNNIGTLYYKQGQYAKALEYHQQSLVIKKAVHGDNHPVIATNLNKIGAVYNAQGKYTLALEHFQQSLMILKAIYGDNHPAVAASLSNIGSVYNTQGQYTQALEVYQQSLLILQVIYDDNHPAMVQCFNNIEDVCRTQDQVAQQKSRKDLQQSKAILQTIQKDFYSLDDKFRIEDTSLIMLLKEETQLSFEGFRNDDYEVDAVAILDTEAEFEKARALQKNLKGNGLFFQYQFERQITKGFVLKGINLPEGKSSKGEEIKSCLLQY